MLNEEQLIALMADIESDTAERTESTNNEKMGQAHIFRAILFATQRRQAYFDPKG
ncbi:MAG: hypothetical protein Q8R67_26200 [Rhodoferax sp.]|nr:hypothetical protein [Rhodoferax sp.]MDP3655166.1 hypothetical protein [Rhodoferax sp.]